VSGTDAAVLAEHLNDPARLLVVGGRVYWVESRDFHHSKLKSIPVEGGEPKVVADVPGLYREIATDGNAIYFTRDGGGADVFDLHRVGLDGSGETLLAAHIPYGANGGPGLILADGNVYWAGLVLAGGTIATGIWSLPSTPATPPAAPKLVTPAGYDGVGMPSPNIAGIRWVGPKSFVFGMIGQNGAGLLYAAPDRHKVVELWADDLSGDHTPQGTGTLVVGDDLYFITANLNSRPRGSTLWKVPAAGGGAAVKVADLAGIEAQFLAGDDKGMYVNNTSHQGQPMGIYRVSPSGGAATLLATTPTMSVLAEPRAVAVDDHYVYFLDGGHNPGPPDPRPANATLYRKPR
jgi:hypothetical protein